ncbi:hypothetical protein E4U25_007318, partial [Claviceps purpurea]
SSSLFCGTATNAAGKSVSKASALLMGVIVSSNYLMIWLFRRLRTCGRWERWRDRSMRRRGRRWRRRGDRRGGL